MLDLYLLLRVMWSQIGLGSQFPAVCIMMLYSLMAHQTWGVRREKVQGPEQQHSESLCTWTFQTRLILNLKFYVCFKKNNPIKKIPDLDDVPIGQGCSFVVVALTQ